MYGKYRVPVNILSIIPFANFSHFMINQTKIYTCSDAHQPMGDLQAVFFANLGVAASEDRLRFFVNRTQ